MISLGCIVFANKRAYLEMLFAEIGLKLYLLA